MVVFDKPTDIIHLLLRLLFNVCNIVDGVIGVLTLGFVFTYFGHWSAKLCGRWKFYRERKK